MQNVIFLIFRRMRLPLIMMIAAYAISILGFTLIPGIDDNGNRYRMDFFHAFYFVSFMGSTIGFGEIPYTFTEAQRAWATLTIYITVISWLYGIGSLLTILQDTAFRRVFEFSGFSRRVKYMRSPFYVICGYGDTGGLLVAELAARGINCTVIDIDQNRISLLALEDLPVYVPGLCADANNSEALIAAGLHNPYCRGVVAVTNDDSTNLKVAITTKLLTPDRLVICRAETQDMAANMASFGTDHIINPYETFGDRFGMLFHSPSMYLIYEWITSVHNAPLRDFVTPPPGEWVLCGYGRFGKAIRRQLNFEGVQTRIIEADPIRTQPPQGTVVGRGTEADTLIEAGIKHAVGVIAGTDDDSNNLSILITAKDINSRLFTTARQNERRNDDIFGAFPADLIMQPSTITARGILALIVTPLMHDFLEIARKQDEDWANILVSRVSGIVTDKAPEMWSLIIDNDQAYALEKMLSLGRRVTLGEIARSPHDRSKTLPVVPFLIKRGGENHLLPEDDTALQSGDHILFCGLGEAHQRMDLSVKNYNVLNYLLTGEERPAGLIWRLIGGTGKAGQSALPDSGRGDS